MKPAGNTPAGQLGLPLGRPKTGQEIEAVAVGKRAMMVQFVKHRRARHYVLRVRNDGSVRVTMPRYGTRADAVAFLRRQLRWVDTQRYAAARNDAAILVRGESVPLMAQQDGARSSVEVAGEHLPLRRGETARAAAVRHLHEVARRDLPPRLRALAGELGLAVKRVTVRNQQTRWGSCSSDGSISLNWRLVQMPDSVRDYILVHELMHLREDGHGRRFWQLVEKACPHHREARRWLKAHERELM